MNTVLLFLGLCLFTLGFWFFLRSLAFARKGLTTRGTVIHIAETADSDGDKTYRPTFRYVTHNNEQLEFVGAATGPRQSWFVGDEAIIIYDPDDPRRSKLFSYFGTFGIAVVLMMGAMPLIVSGCAPFIFEMLVR